MIVVKVGGSLYDWPDLGARLSSFCSQLAEPALIVPGGGRAADAVRAIDRTHRLGEEASHWLALRACTLNGYALAAVLHDVPLTTDFSHSHRLAIVDLFQFAVADEFRPDHWPHLWDVTSDSMAMRVAQVAGAEELVLLKSVDVAGDWFTASELGHVDAFFPIALSHVPKLRVRAVNLRTAS